MENYTELFRISYDGTVGEIKEEIENLDGIKKATTSERNHRPVETTVDFEITYDSHMTDRTWLATQIENINGVTDEVVFA